MFVFAERVDILVEVIVLSAGFGFDKFSFPVPGKTVYKKVAQEDKNCCHGLNTYEWCTISDVAKVGPLKIIFGLCVKIRMR